MAIARNIAEGAYKSLQWRNCRHARRKEPDLRSSGTAMGGVGRCFRKGYSGAERFPATDPSSAAGWP